MPRYIRVRSEPDAAFVEFDFAIGYPDLFVEWSMPRQAFRQFCENNRRHMDAAMSEAVDADAQKWRYGETATLTGRRPQHNKNHRSPPMSVEIKTTTVETIRTPSATPVAAFGDKVASRYQEASFDLESATNFHYRPLWQPDKLLNDATRTAVVMADWYAVSDPRQYYYGTYVQARARMQENAEHDYAFCEKRDMLAGLSGANVQLIARCCCRCATPRWAPT
jgi:hypothetical protein